MKNKIKFSTIILISASMSANSNTTLSNVSDALFISSILSSDNAYLKIGGLYGKPIGIDNNNASFNYEAEFDISFGFYANEYNRIYTNYRPGTEYSINNSDATLNLDTINLGYDHIIPTSLSNIILGAQIGYTFLDINNPSATLSSPYGINASSLSYGLSAATEIKINNHFHIGSSLNYYMYSEFTDEISIKPNVSIGLYSGFKF